MSNPDVRTLTPEEAYDLGFNHGFAESSLEQLEREIPDEQLWEDGELKLGEVMDKIHYHVIFKGDWKVVEDE